MGKLVLYLADGTTMDVPLGKERVTIGRRPDNDICLPYPAVSGEHAQVVTILSDSFLEDLGSTNGTLVNGKPVAKHFLADRDQIDIGRQRLTYLSDDTARIDPLPPDIALKQMRGLTDKVESARPRPKVDGARSGGSGAQFGARGPRQAGRAVDEIERDFGASVEAMPQPQVMPDSPPPRAAPDSPPPRAAPDSPPPSRPAGPPGSAAAGPSSALASNPPSARTAERVDTTASPPAAAERAGAPTTRGPSVRVLSGASQGRSVPFPGPELTVGRVGVQVAVVRKVEGGYVLIPIEGKEPPRINGAAVAHEGSPLHPGDTFEVAGVRLELSAGP